MTPEEMHQLIKAAEEQDVRWGEELAASLEFRRLDTDTDKDNENRQLTN